MPKISRERAMSLRAQNDERFTESAKTIYDDLMEALKPVAHLMIAEDRLELAAAADELYRLRAPHQGAVKPNLKLV